MLERSAALLIELHSWFFFGGGGGFFDVRVLSLGFFFCREGARGRGRGSGARSGSFLLYFWVNGDCAFLAMWGGEDVFNVRVGRVHMVKEHVMRDVRWILALRRATQQMRRCFTTFCGKTFFFLFRFLHLPPLKKTTPDESLVRSLALRLSIFPSPAPFQMTRGLRRFPSRSLLFLFWAQCASLTRARRR